VAISESCVAKHTSLGLRMTGIFAHPGAIVGLKLCLILREE